MKFFYFYLYLYFKFYSIFIILDNHYFLQTFSFFQDFYWIRNHIVLQNAYNQCLVFIFKFFKYHFSHFSFLFILDLFTFLKIIFIIWEVSFFNQKIDFIENNHILALNRKVMNFDFKSFKNQIIEYERLQSVCLTNDSKYYNPENINFN